MLVNYNDLSPEAKVWVYPSSRKFYPQELTPIKNKIENFINNQKDEIKICYLFLYDRFIIFLIDQNNSSINNYIEKQVSFILNLQQEYKVTLLDKMNICFKQGEFIQYKEVKDLKKLVKNKSLSSKTIVFDNLIQTKAELESYWEVPITKSWYSRFL